MTPTWNDPTPSRLGEFALSDHHGKTITRRSTEGKITVANFFFTSCRGICPMTMANLKKVEAAYSRDPGLLFLSHTVDPERDTVEALEKYAAKHRVQSPRWHLLTGSKKEIYELARGSYFADKDLGKKASEDDFLHTETVYLLDPEGRIRGVYNGTVSREMLKLIEDIRVLKKQSI